MSIVRSRSVISTGSVPVCRLDLFSIRFSLLRMPNIIRSRDVKGSCASFGSGTEGVATFGNRCNDTFVAGNYPLKDIRVRVETYDGLCTIWYERSKLKNACDIISKRVYNQLCGLNIKEVNVSVI